MNYYQPRAPHPRRRAAEPRHMTGSGNVMQQAEDPGEGMRIRVAGQETPGAAVESLVALARGPPGSPGRHGRSGRPAAAPASWPGGMPLASLHGALPFPRSVVGSAHVRGREMDVGGRGLDVVRALSAPAAPGDPPRPQPGRCRTYAAKHADARPPCRRSPGGSGRYGAARLRSAADRGAGPSPRRTGSSTRFSGCSASR